MCIGDRSSMPIGQRCASFGNERKAAARLALMTISSDRQSGVECRLAQGSLDGASAGLARYRRLSG